MTLADRISDQIGYVAGFTGKVRNKPISRRLMNQLRQSLPPGYTARIVSGGQQATRDPGMKGQPGGWTGSHRHDVDEQGFGQAADIILINPDGQEVTVAQDRQAYETLFANAGEAGITGAGHYDSDAFGAHLGGGSPAFWGDDTTATSADPVFQAAFQGGQPPNASQPPQMAKQPPIMQFPDRDRQKPPANMQNRAADPFTMMIENVLDRHPVRAPTTAPGGSVLANPQQAMLGGNAVQGIGLGGFFQPNMASRRRSQAQGNQLPALPQWNLIGI